MLVPQMAKRADRFFLRGLVSRNATTSGNFARANQVEVLASDLGAVLADPDFDLMVVATRHHEHADQVVRCLEAGGDDFTDGVQDEILDRLADEDDGGPPSEYPEDERDYPDYPTDRSPE